MRIVVFGRAGGSGKTTVSVVAAWSLRNVVLVDADLSNPAATALLSPMAPPGPDHVTFPALVRRALGYRARGRRLAYVREGLWYVPSAHDPEAYDLARTYWETVQEALARFLDRLYTANNLNAVVDTGDRMVARLVAPASDVGIGVVDPRELAGAHMDGVVAELARLGPPTVVVVLNKADKRTAKLYGHLADAVVPFEKRLVDQPRSARELVDRFPRAAARLLVERLYARLGARKVWLDPRLDGRVEELARRLGAKPQRIVEDMGRHGLNLVDMAGVAEAAERAGAKYEEALAAYLQVRHMPDPVTEALQLLARARRRRWP